MQAELVGQTRPERDLVSAPRHPSGGQAVRQRTAQRRASVPGHALDLAALQPTATKLVSNLPYNVATPVIAERLAGLPALELWCVMVQREVADRLFAPAGTKAYGAVSVMVRLAARRTGFHAVSC